MPLGQFPKFAGLRPRDPLEDLLRAPVLTPEQEESLIAQIGSGALGGLAYIGETLNKPSRALWGTLSGLAGEGFGGGLLNLIPFSDTLGLTDPNEGIEASRFLENLGVMPQNTPGFDMLDPLRFGLDVAGDPTTYLTFGAAAAGKAAGAAGKAGKSVKPLAGLQVPFLQKTPIPLGTGPLGQKTRKALETITSKASESAPARFGKMLFDPAAGGFFDPMKQEVAGLAHERMPGARAAARGVYGENLEELDAAYQAFDEAFGETILSERSAGSLPEFGDLQLGGVVRAGDRGNYGYVQGLTNDFADVFFRNPETGATAVKRFPHAEQGLKPVFSPGSDQAAQFARSMTQKVFDDLVQMTGETAGDVGGAFGELFPSAAGRVPQNVSDAISRVAGDMQQANRAIWSSIEAKGGDVNWLPDIEGAAHMPRYVAPNVAREQDRLGRVLPAGVGSSQHRAVETRSIPEAIINRMLKDPDVRRADDGAYWIEQKYSQWIGKDPAYEFPWEHADALHEYVRRHAPKELYTRGVADNFLKYQTDAHRLSASLDAVHELYRRNVIADGSDGIELAKAFKHAGLREDAVEHFARTMNLSPDEAAKLMIKPEAVNASRALLETFRKPEWANELVKQIDRFTKIFKESVTLPFPSFFFRNLTSGQYVNLATGQIQTPGDLSKYGAAFREANRLRRTMQRGEALSDADRALVREIDAWEVVAPHGFEDVEIFRGAGQGVVPESPFDFGTTRREAAQRVADEPSFLDPLPGGQTARRAYETVVGTGAKANQQVEWMNRVPLYKYLRDKGLSPGEAAAKVKEMHIDYSDFGPVEKQLFKRMFPFYSFTRKMAPFTLRTLAERPGGAMAQTIRALGDMRGEQDPLLPDYLRETAAIPLPAGESGDPRFLTGVGLFFEDPLSFVGGGVRGAGLEALSRANPLAKGPIEYFSGQSFFQKGPRGGRPLEDLDPTLGRTLANLTGRDEPVETPELLEAALANSPLTRVATTLRTLTDARKGPGATAANLFTGLRVTDLPERTTDAVVRERTTELMRQMPGSRVFERVYFSKDELKKMEPEEQQRALRMQALINALAERAKARTREEKEDGQR